MASRASTAAVICATVAPPRATQQSVPRDTSTQAPTTRQITSISLSIAHRRRTQGTAQRAALACAAQSNRTRSRHRARPARGQSLGSASPHPSTGGRRPGRTGGHPALAPAALRTGQRSGYRSSRTATAAPLAHRGQDAPVSAPRTRPHSTHTLRMILNILWLLIHCWVLGIKKPRAGPVGPARGGCYAATFLAARLRLGAALTDASSAAVRSASAVFLARDLRAGLAASVAASSVASSVVAASLPE